MMRRWWRDEDASAAIEAGFLFPIMLSILMGTVDIGMALNTNQKLVNAAGMIADLVAQNETLTDDALADIVAAGRLALQPYGTGSFGYDIAGVQFDGKEKTPVVRWRDVENMEINASLENRVAGLGDENEGVVAVTVEYIYRPFFTNFVVGEIKMAEISIARNRKGVFVSRT